MCSKDTRPSDVVSGTVLQILHKQDYKLGQPLTIWMPKNWPRLTTFRRNTEQVLGSLQNELISKVVLLVDNSNSAITEMWINPFTHYLYFTSYIFCKRTRVRIVFYHK